LSAGTLLSTDSWGYGDSTFGDRLTAYNGETVSYDAYGRVSRYRGEYVGYYWDTHFERIYNIGSVYFTYHEDGMRRTKSVGNLTHSYTYDGINLVREEWGDNTLIFLYDASGSPVGMQYRNSSYASGAWDVYFYEKNLQGDIVSVYTEDRTLLVSYTYDAWGSFTVTYHNGGALTSAAYNPFTYRGYYYDTETGLYYVSSRYYDPEIGRWINADIPETLTADFENFAQYNLFAYCFNNPVNMSDETGTWPSWAKKVVAAVAVVAVVAAVAAVTVATAGAGTAAAVIAVGAAKGAAIGMASGAAIGAATGAVSHRVSTGSWSGAGTAALNGMGDGALSGAVTGAITGAAGSAVKVSQAAKAWDSGTFKSGYQSMKYHYNKHVVSEGLTKGNNVLKYTQDAVRFANRNSSVLKYTYNYNYGNASWNLTYSTGQGGMFTSAGKILTFWYR